MAAELEALRRAPPPPVVEAPTAAEAPPPSAARDQPPGETIETTEQATEPVISSSQERVKVSISGQVNRAVNFANDGDSTKAYFVDSDVSNSRTRVLGLANYNDDIRFGGLLEVAFSPNNSFDVSQDNEVSDDLIDVRRAETGVDSKRWGRLWFGKGSAATDNVAEYDLSGIDVIMYAGVADIVGGLQFRDDDGDLTGLTVGDAFFDFDGDRQDRVRYDTPVFGPGMQFSVSAGADQRYDAALNWGGDFDQWSGVDIGSFTTLAAIGISDPSDDGVDYRLRGSGSVLHNPTGLNLTFSGGMDQADEGDPYNLYAKGGWYGTLNSLGNTGWASTSPAARTFPPRATPATRSVVPSCRRSRATAPSFTAKCAGTRSIATIRRASMTSWSARSARGSSSDARPAEALRHLLLVLALVGACVPIRAADPPRRNTEIPQGPGLFTGEAGELVILRR